MHPIYTENGMATKYEISGQPVSSRGSGFDLCLALSLSAFLGVCPPRWRGEFIPFTGAWRWGPAATAVQSWMLLMRNDIPALVVHFCGWLAFPGLLRWPTGRPVRSSPRGREGGEKMNSLIPQSGTKAQRSDSKNPFVCFATLATSLRLCVRLFWLFNDLFTRSQGWGFHRWKPLV